MINAQQAMDILRRMKAVEDETESQRELLRKMVETNAVTSMSARDMIAMTAVGGLAGKDWAPNLVAERAYAIADALLAHKNRESADA